MKKILITLLSLVLALAFVGCTNTAATTTTTTTVAETTTAAAQESSDYYYGILSPGGITEDEWSALYAGFATKAGITVWDDGTKVEDCKAIFYDDMNSALLALNRGDIREIDVTKSVAQYIAAVNPEFAAEDFYMPAYNALSMAVKSDNTELLEKLNAAITALKEDGTLAALEAEYTADLSKLPEVKDIPTIDGAETIRVVLTGDIAPFDYVTPDGKAAGYNVALLSAISEKANLNIELVYTNSASRYLQLTSGKADVVFWAFGTSYSDSAEFDYSADLPNGVAITEHYTEQPIWCVAKK